MNNKYIIKLPNGEKLLLWFIGDKLEVLMDAYNIEYEKVGE